MRRLSTALKLLLVILLLAVGIAVLDLRVIQPLRTSLQPGIAGGRACLSFPGLKDWPGKNRLDNARNQDDFERHTITQAPSIPCVRLTTITRNCLPVPWRP